VRKETRGCGQGRDNQRYGDDHISDSARTPTQKKNNRFRPVNPGGIRERREGDKGNFRLLAGRDLAALQGPRNKEQLAYVKG